MRRGREQLDEAGRDPQNKGRYFYQCETFKTQLANTCPAGDLTYPLSGVGTKKHGLPSTEASLVHVISLPSDSHEQKKLTFRVTGL